MKKPQQNNRGYHGLQERSLLSFRPLRNYLVRIAIPKYMSHLFGGKRYFMKSTGTRDVREARLFRDAVALNGCGYAI